MIEVFVAKRCYERNVAFFFLERAKYDRGFRLARVVNDE